jgi:glycosyltransferase involved in cell wall biosynthesis
LSDEKTFTDSLSELEESLTAKTPLQTRQLSSRYADLKVLGLVADDTACGRYRIIHPFNALREHGAQADWVRVASLADMMRYDIIIAQRQYDPNVLEMLEKAMFVGKTVLYEVDDDLHRVHPSSPAYLSYYPSSLELKMVSEFLERLHGATVSTEDLRASYYRHQVNTHVVPNCIDFSHRNWNNERPEGLSPESLVFGWAGGTTHQTDLMLLDEVVPTILEKYPHTLFGIYTAQEHAMEFCERNDIPLDRVWFENPRHFMDYPEGLSAFDIGLAPIVPTAFNCAKSNLKFLEYWAYKMPVIGSKVGPYARILQETNGEGGFLADGPEEWISALSYLIENETARKAMGESGYEVCFNHYNLDTSLHLAPEAWMQIRAHVAQGNFGKPGVVNTSKPRYRHSPYQIFGRIGRNELCPCDSGKKYKKCACYGAWG